MVRVAGRTVWRPINQEADLRNHHHACSVESERKWTFLKDKAIHSLSRCCGEGGNLRGFLDLSNCGCVFSCQNSLLSCGAGANSSYYFQFRLTVVLQRLHSAARLWHTESNQRTKQIIFSIIRSNETTGCFRT